MRSISITYTILFGWMMMVSLTSFAKLPDFTDLVEQHKKTVVNISTKQKAEELEGPMGNGQPFPFDEFFKRFFEEEMPKGGSPFVPRRRESSSLGSGFIISEDGYILTNAHVVSNAEEIIVKLYDRRELSAELVGKDVESDLALLKVDADGLPVAQFGDSKDLAVGEWVFAIGSPFGFEHSVTAGIVSAKSRSMGSEQRYVPFIQTDVAINPGNSGGPLFNMDGEVIGVNSMIVSRTGGYMGLSFSIPIDLAKSVVKQLKESGKVVHGWLGVLFQPVTRELAKAYGLDSAEGALVAEVVEDSPAEKGGIEVGDVVVKFNGVDIYDANKLPHIVGRSPAGEKVKVQVIRNGDVKTLTITIGELPEQYKAEYEVEDAKKTSESFNKLGLQLEALSDEDKNAAEIDYGLKVIKVESGSAADKAELRMGDILLMVNRKKLLDEATFNDLVTTFKAGDTLALLIKRGKSRRFVALKLADSEEEKSE